MERNDSVVGENENLELTPQKQAVTGPVWVQSDIVPENNRNVLTFEPGSRIPVWPGYWDSDRWYDLEGNEIKNVTHWMEFPAPPN